MSWQHLYIVLLPKTLMGQQFYEITNIFSTHVFHDKLNLITAAMKE